MKIKQITKLTILFTLLASSTLIAQKKPVIFVNTVQVEKGTGIPPEYAKEFTKQLFFKLSEKYSSLYDVNDEKAMKALDKQYEKMLQKNCDAKACLEQISDKLKARFTISGDLGKSGEYITLSFTNIVRTGDNELNTKQTPIKYLEFQKDYFIDEIVKLAVNPNYTINTAGAPKTPSFDFKPTELTFQKIETGKIDVVKFTTQDENLNAKLEKYKNKMKEAEDFAKKQDYSKALEEYTNINKLINNLTANDKKLLAKFQDNVESTIINVYNQRFQKEIEEISNSVKGKEDRRGELENAKGNFIKSLRAYLSIGTGDEYPKKTILDSIVIAYTSRISDIDILIRRQDEKEADREYYAQNFTQAIKRYQSIEEDINKSIKDLEAINTRIPKQNKNYARLLGDISTKINTTKKTGLDFVRNQVKKYTFNAKDKYEDWGLETDKNSEKAKSSEYDMKKSMDEAYQVILFSGFRADDIKTLYNDVAKAMINNKDLPEASKPKPIGNIDAEIAKIEEDNRQAEAKRRQAETDRQVRAEKRSAEFRSDMAQRFVNTFQSTLWAGAGIKGGRGTLYAWTYFFALGGYASAIGQAQTAKKEYDSAVSNDFLFRILFSNSSSTNSLLLLTQLDAYNANVRYRAAVKNANNVSGAVLGFLVFNILDTFFFSTDGSLFSDNNQLKVLKVAGGDLNFDVSPNVLMANNPMNSQKDFISNNQMGTKYTLSWNYKF